jgi:hypothetical protein
MRRVTRQLLKSAQFDFAAITDGGFSVPCAPDRNAALHAALNNIRRRLDAIAKRPMTSHEVQEALGISARERIRWTKDNRLRTSGTGATCSQAVSEPNRISLLGNTLASSMPGWLDRSAYGTHSMRRTKAAQIYRKTGNLRAV